MALSTSDHRLAAMARHPAAGPWGPATSTAASFDDVVSLLTGQWRVDDPTGFAAAMSGAPVLAGHPVLDARAVVSSPDPWTARTWAALTTALAGLAGRADVAVRAVSGSLGGRVFVEGRAEMPGRAGTGAAFAVAHLVEVPHPSGRLVPAGGDDAWVVVVAGDASGGVAGVLRAGRAPATWARPHLAGLRGRLLEAGGVAAPTADAGPAGTVLSFTREGRR